jgi:hypothetical protein
MDTWSVEPAPVAFVCAMMLAPFCEFKEFRKGPDQWQRALVTVACDRNVAVGAELSIAGINTDLSAFFDGFVWNT